MDIHDATEQAYKNGYAKGYEDGKASVEVKHGRWIEHYAYECWHYDCPFCDDGYATKERDNTPPNYCQNCGAKMDGKE